MAEVLSMQDVIKDDDKRAQIVNETAELVDAEVKRKKGIGGAAIKTGYKVVKRLHKGRFIHDVVSGLLDDFIDALEPIHAEHREAGAERPFDVVLKEQEERAADALLGVTDARADNAKNAIVRKTYKKLRPRAKNHVQEALPALGQLVDRHTKGGDAD